LLLLLLLLLLISLFPDKLFGLRNNSSLGGGIITGNMNCAFMVGEQDTIPISMVIEIKVRFGQCLGDKSDPWLVILLLNHLSFLPSQFAIIYNPIRFVQNPFVAAVAR